MTDVRRRKLGLPARAALFVALLLVVSGACSVLTITAGLSQEGDRQQRIGAELTSERVSLLIGDEIARGVFTEGYNYTARVTSFPHNRRASVYDAQAGVVAENGAPAYPEEAGLVRQALESERMATARVSDGSVIAASPLRAGGRVVGASVVTAAPRAHNYDLSIALAPFLVFLGLMVVIGAPVTAYFVRRLLLPLDQLTHFAENVAAKGATGRLDVKTRDEFETLANAFNHMMDRIDASMRKIQKIAYVDPVTQLPNHDRFVHEINYYALQAEQHHQIGAVYMFEFERLPRMMQTLDQDQIRDLIKTISERLVAATRTVDRVVRVEGAAERPSTVARIGGGAFAVFTPNLTSPADAARFAQHVNAALNQPLEWRGHRVLLGAHCGVALIPRDGKDADSVMRPARMALAAAATTPARVKVFTPALDREVGARMGLEREMRAALERNEFRAFFQPKINLRTGRVEAAEALARWVRPDRTIISPGRFIPVAEESGLIGQVSDAILREACWKAAAWGRAGYPISVAVNVSTLQFRDDKFADHVLRVLDHAGLAPSRLELEITESVAMEDPERALRLIEPLRNRGVRFAIDDFGCGHSSLSALSKLPFDVIKIDQQFIRAYSKGDAQAAAIIEMILALASTLGMDVVAEGIEKPEEADFVIARGCVWGQGFLYGAAEPPGDFAEALRRQAGEAVAAVQSA